VNADYSITWLNKYTKPAVTPPVVNVPNVGDNPNGYLRLSWTRSMYNTTTSGPAAYITQQWRGYPDNSGATPLRYILPLHNSTISSSLVVLKNQYGY
jgi:starch-binding outer membrane protein, SusD/RagB family